MKKTILLGSASVVVAVAMLAAGFVAGRPSAMAEDAPQATEKVVSGSEMERAAVEKIVRDYLLANPELMLEVQTALETKQKEQQQLANVQTIEDSREQIFNSAQDGVVGNPDGKVTIVEFYDYNCGYCKRAQEDMLALIKDDPNVRFVLKEFPILGADSQKAHIVSQAFLKLMPEKYGEFHNQLLGSQGRATEASAMALALSLGADEAKLREAMQDPSIGETFQQTYDLANRLSITGTPSYVVGKEVVFGALGKDVLAEKVAAAKDCLSNAC
jgi:protein-disulfide isomerase